MTVGSRTELHADPRADCERRRKRASAFFGQGGSTSSTGGSARRDDDPARSRPAPPPSAERPPGRRPAAGFGDHGRDAARPPPPSGRKQRVQEKAAFEGPAPGPSSMSPVEAERSSRASRKSRPPLLITGPEPARCRVPARPSAMVMGRRWTRPRKISNRTSSGVRGGENRTSPDFELLPGQGRPARLIGSALQDQAMPPRIIDDAAAGAPAFLEIPKRRCEGPSPTGVATAPSRARR